MLRASHSHKLLEVLQRAKRAGPCLRGVYSVLEGVGGGRGVSLSPGGKVKENSVGTRKGLEAVS